MTARTTVTSSDKRALQSLLLEKNFLAHIVDIHFLELVSKYNIILENQLVIQRAIYSLAVFVLVA